MNNTLPITTRAIPLPKSKFQDLSNLLQKRDKEVILLIDQMLQKAKKEHNPDDMVDALFLRASYYNLVLNDYHQSLRIANSAKKWFPNTTSSLSKARIHRIIGVNLHFLGDKAKAAESYLQGAQVLENESRKLKLLWHELAGFYYNLGVLHNSRQADVAMLHYLQKAEKIYRKKAFENGLALCYGSIGVYYGQHGDTDKSLLYYEKSLALKRKIKDPYGESIALANIGEIYTDVGDYKKAKKFLDTAMEMSINLGDRNLMCHNYQAMAQWHFESGQYKDSLKELHQALQIAEDLSLKEDEWQIHELYAEVYEALGYWQKSLAHYKKYHELEARMKAKEREQALLETSKKFEANKEKEAAKILQKKNKEISIYVSKLEESNNELKQFAHIASHDLKEPVRTIKMYLTLLEKNIPGLSTENKDYIQYTKVASERLYYLINDLLAYSKIDHTDNELSAVDTTKVLKEVTESIQQLVVDKNAVIKFQKLPTVIANHNKLLLLFQNLIINGINYNKSDIPTIKISYKINGNTALIVVADNGIGIAEEYWEKIFQLFKRLHTESDYKGTGLGLAICKKIVERLNGKIWLRSQQEKGSEFYIQLPC